MRTTKPRTRPILTAAVELPLDPKRPDPALPLIIAAFFLGIVLTTATLLAFNSDDGDTVPASQVAELQARNAAQQATTAGAAKRLAAQQAAYADMVALNRRLSAALADAHATTRRIAAQPAAVDTSTIERVRVVRIPTAAPTRTTTVAATQREPVPPAATPPAPARPCTLATFDRCLVSPGR